MVQNFNPRVRESERNFDYSESNQYGGYQEINAPDHDQDHTACGTPNPPSWCGTSNVSTY